jgi:hypothetical protein
MPMSPRLLRPRAAGGDSDVRNYIAAVELADGQALEQSVKDAIRDFILGCKTDNTWSAIKASCILMGARTLSGALTPLVGSAPTNNGPFVSGDYNRKTGLVGNGTSKYLNTGYTWSGTTLNDRHLSVYQSSLQPSSANGTLIGSVRQASPSPIPRHQIISAAATASGKIVARLSSETSVTSSGNLDAVGLVGLSRAASASYTARGAGTSETMTSESVAGSDGAVWVFAREFSGSELYSSARLAFYSAGNALTLASLDSRVSTLYTAIGAAIP